MKIGVPKEQVEGEQRVALVPETAEKLLKQGFDEILVESGAGRDYNLDDAYEEAGARIVSDAESLYDEADVVLKIRKPSDEEIGKMGEGTVLVAFLEPLTDPELSKKVADQGITSFSLEMVPRIARAQSMDALSSMGAIGGYKSALIAADSLGRYLPMMTTAAGTTKAAKAMILGVGVAGLQAIATMRRLGAEVEAFDIRPEVKEQVQSLGATFIDAEDEESDEDSDGDGEATEEREPSTGEKLMGGLRALLGLPEREEEDDSQNGSEPQDAQEQGEDDGDEDEDDEDEDSGGYAKEQSEEKQKKDRDLLARRITEMDVVLTTAQVPGKKAPILLTTDMVESMKPGSVVVDLAAEQGGNCELTEPGEVVSHEQVRIHGPIDVPSSMPIHASQLLSRNMASLLSHLFEEGELELDFDDEITNDACITHDGELRHERTREALEGSKAG